MASTTSGESNFRPISRLTAKIVFSGFVMACRRARLPISRSPEVVKDTTDGVVGKPSRLGMTTGLSPSR